jgi:hypothetical protein
LVKELRLNGISTIERANKFLERYRETHNKKFGKEPSASENLHRALKPGEDLKRILCHVSWRELSKDLTFQFKNTIYQIKGHEALPKEQVEILELGDGALEIWSKGTKLKFSRYNESYKKLNKEYQKEYWLKKIDFKHLPKSKDHPWKSYEYNKMRRKEELKLLKVI